MTYRVALIFEIDDDDLADMGGKEKIETGLKEAAWKLGGFDPSVYIIDENAPTLNAQPVPL